MSNWYWFLILLLVASNLFHVYRNSQLPYALQKVLIKNLCPQINIARLAIHRADKKAALEALDKLESYINS